MQVEEADIAHHGQESGCAHGLERDLKQKALSGLYWQSDGVW